MLYNHHYYPVSEVFHHLQFVAQSPPRSQASSAIITPIPTNTHIVPCDSESRNISLAREEEAVLLKHYNIIC